MTAVITNLYYIYAYVIGGVLYPIYIINDIELLSVSC